MVMTATARPTAGELLDHLRPYLHGMASRMAARLRVDRDDALQELLLAVVREAARYDPARGRPEAWAGVVIAGRATRALARARGREEAGGELADAPDRRGEAIDLDAPLELETVRAAVDQLPERGRHVITRRYGLDGRGGATLDEVGEELGVSFERVRQIQRQALARLRRLVGEGEATARSR